MTEERIATGGGAALAMTEDGKPARTLDMVTAEIKFLDAQAGRLVMGHALEIGRRLTEAKELVPYGEWGNYLEKELHYSQSTANKLMKVFQEFGASQMGLFGPEVESESFTNLTYSKALALLSVPREEREDFLREVDAEGMSTRELKEAIRERDEARKRAEEAERQIKSVEEREAAYIEKCDRNVDYYMKESLAFEKKNAQLEKELAEIKSRPVDVAVQEPDPDAVEARAKELADKARGELEKSAAAQVSEAKRDAKAKIKAAEEAKREVEIKLQEAQEKLQELFKKQAETDNEKTVAIYQAEINRMQKELSVSGAAVAVAKTRFAAWQEAYRQLTASLEEVSFDSRERLENAIRAQARAWAGTE